MKKAGNRFSTKSLSDMIGEDRMPNKMANTPEKSTPDVQSSSNTIEKTSETVSKAIPTPLKNTPDIAKVNVESGIDKNTPTVSTLEKTPAKSTPTVSTPLSTPVKSTPEVGKINVTLESPTPQVNKLENTPLKPSADIKSIEPTVAKTSATVSNLAETPTKTTPNVEPLSATPVKSTPEIGSVVNTPTKPSAEVSNLAATPNKPTPDLGTLKNTPLKPSAEVSSLIDTPVKPSANISNLANTPEKPTAEVGNLSATPTKQAAEVSNLANTPEKPTAEVSNLSATPTKPTAEITTLSETPEKQSAEVSNFANTPEKPSAEVSNLAETPEKQAAEVSNLSATPIKSTAKLSTLANTPEKQTAEVSNLADTPTKTTADVVIPGNTLEKQSAEVSNLPATPTKTTAEVVIPGNTPTKTTPDSIIPGNTPTKTTPEIVIPGNTPTKTTPDLGVIGSTEKTTLDPIPFAATAEKTTPDVIGLSSTPEKSTAIVSALAATLEKTTLDPIPFAATPEKTVGALEVRDGFANLDQTGFFTGKASGRGLLTDFVGISGLPTAGTGQFDHTGNQGLGVLATNNHILNVDANGFTVNQKHLGDSDLIGISGDPGSMTYTIPDGPSPRASYRYNKEMYSKITGAPQTFTTPGGFIVTGTGASGTLTNDGINSARNSISSGKSQLLEQYNKFDLRDEAFHRFDGFTSGLGQPYINSKVIANDNVALRSFKGQDGLVRGGIVSRVIRTVNDTLRIGKFLISPTGLLFIAKNIGMQLTNPKVETVAGIDGGGFFARTTRIYPLGLSTLAQIVADVAPVGTIGLIRHGLGPLESEANYYENVVSETKKLGGFEVSKNASAPTGNRLVKLTKDMDVGLSGDGSSLLNILSVEGSLKDALGSVLGGVGGKLAGFFNSKILGAAKDKLGVLANFIPGIVGGGEIDLLSGIMGPNSIYGIGRTDIRRSTSGIPLGRHSEANGTWSDSKIVISNHDKGVGSLTADIDDTHKGVKTNPNNAVVATSPLSPYSDAINSTETDNSIHTNGDDPQLEYNDIKTFDKKLGVATTMKSGNPYFTEGGYAEGQRVGSAGNPAGQNNRDRKVVDRFPINFESDLYVDNTVRDTAESSRLAKILDDNSSDVTPAGLKKYNDLPGDKTEQVVHSTVEQLSVDPYGPTLGQIGNYEVYAYGDIPSEQLAHNKIRDFRKDLTNANKTFQQDDDYETSPRESKFGQNYGERGIDRSDRKAVLTDQTGTEIGDKILLNAFTDPGKTTLSQLSNTEGDDLCMLSVAGIQFRAYIKGLSHNVKPEFQSVEYVGRLTDVKLMSKFSVDFSLDFQVAAFSGRELEAMYFKLNRLAQKVAPSYSEAGQPKGPMNRITVGDYFSNQLCFINNVGFTMNEQSPWDIDPGRQLPYYIDVNLSADIITSAYDNLLSVGSDFFGAMTTTKEQEMVWKSDFRNPA